jgi:murein DD-endopeptidase MepM/ murein hydrolase activator NlpD
MAKKTPMVLDYTEPNSWLPLLLSLIFICLLPVLFVKIFNLCPKLITHHHRPASDFHDVSSLYFEHNFNAAIEHSPEASPTTHVQPSIPVSVQPKANSEHGRQSIVIEAKRGDTLGKIFKNLGLNAKQLQEIFKSTPHSKYLRQFKPGQKFEFTLQDRRILKLSLPISPIQDLVIEARGSSFLSRLITKPSTPRYQSVNATIKGSLYSTAQRMHLSSKIIQQFNTIFARDPEFKRGLRAGDQFSILYKADFVNNIQVNPGVILAASYTSRGNVHEAIHYTNRDGSSSYYTPQGLSLKKGYDRYPIRFSHIASPFSLSRYHPVLHYKRPHYGIDLAAPVGTPIHAIGDGRITKIAYQGGYGNMIQIDHNNVYSTIYGHLSRFEKSMHRGKWVKRGEVIGYVGQTGLASGPHCHYEFHINQQPKNPTTIALPHADPIPRKEMGLFKRKVQQMLAALHRPRSNNKINTVNHVPAKETV